MSKIFSTTYPIRYYECEASGQLNHAYAVRLALEAAREALAEAVGLEGLGRWFLGELQIEYKGRIEHTDTLTINTHMSGWRDDGAIFSQELLNSTHEIIAIVYADWDHLDPDNLESTTVPTEVLKHFLGDPLPAEAEFETFPDEPPAPTSAFTAVRRVRSHHVHPLGVVDQGWFIDMLEEIHEDASHYGAAGARFQNDYGLSVGRQHNVEWIEQAHEETLKITTYLSELADSECRLVRWTLFTREGDGELVARAQSVWEWVDGNTLEPVAVPNDYLEDLDDQFAE